MSKANQTPEQKARDHIDAMLEQAGWFVQDKEKIDFSAGFGITVREYQTDIGPADYVLFIDKNPIGVIEAKSANWGQKITTVEEQSAGYASARLKWQNDREPLPFVYESTGVLTRFTDMRDPKPRSREVFSFPRPERIRDWLSQSDSLRARLRGLPDLDPTGLRACQISAIEKLEASFKDDHPRALIQMATGSGKTYASITSIYRLLKHADAKRILFLVDTKNLGEQAEQEFMAYVPNDDNRKFTELYNVQRLKSSFVAKDSQVCISTIQRMYSLLKDQEMDEAAEQINPAELVQPKQPMPVVYNGKIPPEFFDFIIIDECHRSIYNLWRQVLEAKILLNGMLAHDRLLDIVENFILFDESKPGATRKVIARNHQVLGVNRAVAAVARQEELKLEFPPEQRLRHRVVELPLESGELVQEVPARGRANARSPFIPEGPIDIIERACPRLGRLGVFWHTQGSGKSYSMVFFAEKVRRKLEGNFTFLLMTDRNALDSQIYKTFVGCGIAEDQTPRAASGDDLEKLLKENHRYVFSLIYKFNKDVDPKQPYSERDDIIVISDEAHRTQAGRLARNLRLALPNAAFIGFTGTPLFKQDEITKRIFGDYVSRYDFKRSEEDGATVKLVYENRGEKLGVARTDLNDRVAAKIEKAELDPDQEALLDKLLGQDYEVITADERLEKIAADFVEHCATRWESGKSMLVCIDKITCARMLQRIVSRWQAKAAAVRAAANAKRAVAQAVDDKATRAALDEEAQHLAAQAAWLDETIVEIIISEAQNEVKDFAKWGFDIIPHRALMKRGFETAADQPVDVETAFKNPKHPFRVAIVCAMWLTGFDVECLSTLYIDKPMKAHSLMQAIARANRVYPGKDFGLIVDYNGMLKRLREALAQYALGDDGDGDEEIVAPIEERVQALIEAIEATEAHLRGLGFDPATLAGSTGFARIKGLKDAVEAVYSSDESKRRFEILARQMFVRFKALLMEPSAFAYAERNDNIEAIYKKLTERRDTADVTELLKALHRIVNEAIRTQAPGDDQAEDLTFDLSRIDMEKLRDEFAKKVRHKATALQDIREIVEQKLGEMLARNPSRMDYQQKYEEIVNDYNREKDRVTIEKTFHRLMELMDELDSERKRAIEEGLNEDELALFDLLKKGNLAKIEHARVKQASRNLLASIKARLSELDRFWEKEQTKADVEVFILDEVYASLPTPPFTAEEKKATAAAVYAHVWQQAVSGEFARVV